MIVASPGLFSYFFLQLTETFVVTLKTKANFPFSRLFSAEGSERPHTILKLPFGTTKVAAYANKIYVCLVVATTMRMFTVLILFI